MQARNGQFYATTYGGGGPAQEGAVIEMIVKSAKPTFSPVAGTYIHSVSVTLSNTTPGTSIYYTLDGTTPTTGSALYAVPITISTTTTLKALAAAAGITKSAVAVGKYTIK